MEKKKKLRKEKVKKSQKKKVKKLCFINYLILTQPFDIKLNSLKSFN